MTLRFPMISADIMERVLVFGQDYVAIIISHSDPVKMIIY
jgi:hypothetical protein